MTRRIAPFCGTIALLAQVFVFQGCGSNSGTTGTGGTTGSGGTAATGGTTGSGGSGALAACGSTLAGMSIGKNVPCTAADTQMCNKTCGPEKTGTKTETCSGTAYTEGDCTFDQSKSYSCYAIPTTPDAMCPTTPPQASMPCSIPDCIVCGGTTGYLDSKGAMNTGYCVCQASATTPTWSCASTSAWPCPSSNGC